jgi:hypothetical protein
MRSYGRWLIRTRRGTCHPNLLMRLQSRQPQPAAEARLVPCWTPDGCGMAGSDFSSAWTAASRRRTVAGNGSPIPGHAFPCRIAASSRALTPHFPPHFPAQRSLDDRRQWVSLRSLTRPDARRCHPATALRYQPQRNSRLGAPVPPSGLTDNGASLGGVRTPAIASEARTR